MLLSPAPMAVLVGREGLLAYNEAKREGWRRAFPAMLRSPEMAVLAQSCWP